MTRQWEKVFVFISSTFNDMHAERDYLIKQVFPQLREWCEQRKLRLVDIDLRWGVTEQDALYNRNVVKVCLDRIDDCRPFFLCFLGQRRGWVPAQSDISDATLEAFPDLRPCVGKTSVTEMEILHALVNPLHRSKQRDPGKPGEFYDPVKYAFFYLRDDTYISQLPANPPQLRQTYTNESIKDTTERAFHDKELERWRSTKIPQTGRPCHRYQAHWDTHLNTPELLLPLQSPSTESVPLERWREQWEKAGVKAEGTDIEVNPAQAEKAREYNRRLTTGRLTNFQAEEKALNQLIVKELQEAIATRFPDHIEVTEETDLQKEMDQHEQFLFISSEGFIRREGDFNALDAYVDGNSNQLFALTAPGGIGKSTLLANWIEHYRSRNAGKSGQSIHFRFIGQSDRSTTVYSLLQFLLREMKEVSKKFTETIPDDPQQLRRVFSKLLEATGKRGKTIIVLDALNQLESGLADLAWLPTQLPNNVKLIVSFKRGDPSAEELYQRLQGQVQLVDARPFVDLEDRRKLVKAYLSQFLKDLDERHLETLIQSRGAENPLFLKVVLSELRVFGAFSNLGEKIRADFGETPTSAFQGVLKRLENDPAYSPIEPKLAVPLLFGLLAHARQGLSAEELTGLFIQALGMDDNESSRQAASDCVHLYLRQVRPFLAYRDGSYDFFFESFRLAAQALYVGGISPAKPAQDWHRRLAEYFVSRPLILTKDGREIPNIHKLMEQVYQLALGDKRQDLFNTLTDFHFLETKIGAINVPALIDDFDLSTRSNSMAEEHVKELSLLRSTLLLATSILAQDKHLLAAQLIGRLREFEFPGIKGLLSQARNKKDSIWFLPITSDLISPGGPLELSLPGYSKLGALSSDGMRIITEENRKENYRLVVLDAKRGNEIFSLNTPMGKVTPDGTRAISTITPHFSSQLIITDLVSRKPTASFEHKNAVRGMAIAPHGGFTITHAASGSIIKIWDLVSGKEQQSLRHSGKEITGLDIIPDGKKVVTYSHERLVLWELQSGNAISEWGAPEGEKIHSVLLTADEQKLVIRLNKIINPYQSNTRVIVWDLLENSSKYNLRQLALVPGSSNNLLSPNRVFAISATGDLINLVSNEIIPIHPPNNQQASYTFSPQSCLILNGGQEFRIWENDNKNVRSVIINPGSEFTHILVCPDAQHILTSSKNGNICLWNAQTGQEEYPPINLANLACLSITPDLQRVITITSDARCSVWEWASGKVIWSDKLGERVRPSHIKVTKDGKFALFSYSYESYGGTPFRVLDLNNLQFRDFIGGATSSGSLIAKDEGCQKIIIFSRPSPSFSVWNLEKEVQEASFSGHNSEINAVTISTDGKRAISASPYFEYVVRDANDGQIVHSMVREDEGGYDTPKALSLDGSQVMIMSEIYDVRLGRSVKSLPGLTWINEVLTPEGWVGVSSIKATKESRITIWDMNNFEIVKEFQSPNPGNLAAVALSQNGWIGAFVNSASKAEIWNIETGVFIGTIPDPVVSQMGVANVQLNNDGKWAGTESQGGEIKLWSLEKIRPEEKTGPETYDPVIALQPAENPDQVLALHEKNNPQFWNVEKGSVSSTLEIKINSYSNVTFNSQGAFSEMVLLDEEKEGVIYPAMLDKKVMSTPATLALLTADHSKAIYYSKEINLKAMDLNEKKNGWEISTAKKAGAFAISPDGRKVVLSAGKKAEIWDLQSKKSLATLEDKAIFSDITTLSFSQDGKSLIAGAYARLSNWNVETGQLHSIFEHKSPGISTDIAFIWKTIITPDQNKVISISGTSSYSCIVIWDLKTGKPLSLIKESGYPFNEPKYFSLLSITPDGKIFMACSSRTIYLFDLISDQIIRTFSTQVERITSCVILPNTNKVAYGCVSGKVYFLEIQNYIPSPPITTAWFSPEINKKPAFGCPNCRSWSEIPRESLGIEIQCPQCKTPLKINPFYVEADWHPIAEAWQRREKSS